MAELTEEQKIIIGVCVGVSVIVLIIIIVFICYIFYGKDKKKRRRNGYKEKLVYDRYDRNPYPVYEKRVPSMIYDPPPPPPMPLPPPPPPPPVRYYEKPAPRPAYRYDTWESRPEPRRKYVSESRWDGVYRNEPIVVPLAEPEYVTSRGRSQEPETIYLNKRQRPHRLTYVDDQALLPRTNQIRRTVYAAPPPTQLRRSRSFHEIRRSTPYVGEWARRPDNLNDFNEHALRQGRDPFLWRN